MGEVNAGATYANEQFRVRGVPEKATIRGTAAVGSAKCPKFLEGKLPGEDGPWRLF
jgi:hypothetical protein